MLVEMELDQSQGHTPQFRVSPLGRGRVPSRPKALSASSLVEMELDQSQGDAPQFRVSPPWEGPSSISAHGVCCQHAGRGGTQPSQELFLGVLFALLVSPEAGIGATCGKQFGMATLLHHAPLFQHQDALGVHYRR